MTAGRVPATAIVGEIRDETEPAGRTRPEAGVESRRWPLARVIFGAGCAGCSPLDHNVGITTSGRRGAARMAKHVGSATASSASGSVAGPGSGAVGAGTAAAGGSAVASGGAGGDQVVPFVSQVPGTPV